MNLNELKAIGKARQSGKYPNLWMARHGTSTVVTALDTDTGASIEVDMSEGMDANAQLETFFAEQGLGAKERAEAKARGLAGLNAERADIEGTIDLNSEDIEGEDVDMSYPIEGEEFA